MITPEIERALIDGSAKLKTFMLATSAVGKIEVPANSFIIILSVTAFPFSDAVGDLGINPVAKKTAIDNRSTHVVELINQSADRVGFIFRNQWKYDYRKTETYVVNSEPVTFDTNIVRTSDVFIQVGNAIGGIGNGNSAVYLPVTWNSQINPNPVSYGQTTSNYWEILDASLLWGYIPSYEQSLTWGPSANNNQPFPFYSGEDALYGRLNDVVGSTAPNNRTPIVHVQYVQLSQSVLKNYQQ